MSSKWSRGVGAVGDCKTCLCRFSKNNNNNNNDPNKTTGQIFSASGELLQQSDSSSSSEEDYTTTLRELCDSQLSTQLLGMLKSMRDDESLCDCYIIVGPSRTKFVAHKVVLAAASPYFRKMFCCGLRESQNGIVNFPDIQPEVLGAVINFIYTGKIQIHEMIVDSLLDAADLFQLSSLRNLCIFWLSKNLTAQTCLGIFILSMLRAHLDLAEKAKNFAIEHFGEVILGEEFLHISPETLLCFLESPYLACDNDGQLLKSLLEWTNHDQVNRRHYLETFLEKINLEQIAPQLLIELLQHPVLINNDDPQVEKMIRDTLNIVLSRKFDTVPITTSDLDGPVLIPPVPPPLRCFYQQDVIISIGGEARQGQSLSNLECFMMGFDGWKCGLPIPGGTEMSIIPTMKNSRMYSAVASNTYNAYVLGGQDSGFSLDIVEKYNIIDNTFKLLNPLPISVHGAGAGFINTKLYLIGGRSSKDLEKRTWVYNEDLDTWTESLAMKNYRVHLAVSSNNSGELFVLGGIGGLKESDDNFLNSVEKFDPLTLSWTNLSPMHEERAFHSSACLEGLLFAVGGSNGKIWLRTTERYDTTSGQWSKVCNMSIARSSFGITCSGGRIYCLGGFDGVNFLNSVEKYNPKTDRWHCVHGMLIERFGCSAVTLKLPLVSNMVAYDFS